MVHQPSGGYQGQVTDILIHAREVESLKRRLNEIYVHHTGQTYKAIEDAAPDEQTRAEATAKLDRLYATEDKSVFSAEPSSPKRSLRMACSRRFNRPMRRRFPAPVFD